MQKKRNTKDLIWMHIVFLIVALGTVANKLATEYPMLSGMWWLFYGLNILSLAVYGVLWQQVLKRIPLTTAFCNKAVTIIWGMVFGWLFFGEAIGWKQLLATGLVMAGVILVVSDGE